MRRLRGVTRILAPLGLALSLAVSAQAEPPARPRGLRVEAAPRATAGNPDKASTATDPKARAARAPVQSASEPAKGAAKQADGAVTPGASEKAGGAPAPLTTAVEGKSSRPDKPGGQRAEHGGAPVDKGRGSAVETATASDKGRPRAAETATPSDKVRGLPTTRTASAPDKHADAPTRGAERPDAAAVSTADSPRAGRAPAGRPREQPR